MITDELLKIHDQLESKTSCRPWATVFKKRAGYGPLIFWSRRPDLEVLFDNIHDARYMAFIRNLAPEMVKEIRTLKGKLAELEKKIEKLMGDTNDS